MQVFIRHSTIVRSFGAFAALWLSAGSAWAGSGGPDAATLQTTLNALCAFLNMASCPQLPTASQLVLEIAGLETAPPDVVRFEGALSPTAVVNAVNPPAGSPFAPSIAPPGSPVAPSSVAPLAFVSGATATVATVTEPPNPDADTFFYAATDGAAGQAPQTLNLVYDYKRLTNPTFAKGQRVAEFSIPLVIVNSDHSETEAPTTIQILGATSGCGNAVPCVSATATSKSFGPVDPAKLGVTVTLAFQPSEHFSDAHAVFSVQAKLVVTQTRDPAYFASGSPFFAAAFKTDELGASSKVLSPPAIGIGIAPYAAPQCPGGANCAGTQTPSHFPYCASIADDFGTVRSAVAAFLSIGTVGATSVSAPVQPLPGVTCPF